MAGARMPGAACRTDRLEGASAAGGGQSGSRHHAQRRGSAHLPAARQTRHCRRRAQPARVGIPPRRSQIRVTSSISRQLIFWLAVPLMLIALCGGLIHYFNSVAPGVISSDRRLKGAANALIMHLGFENQRFNLAANPDAKPPLPAPESIDYAVRDVQGTLLLGDPKLMGAALDVSAGDAFAMA